MKKAACRTQYARAPEMKKAASRAQYAKTPYTTREVHEKTLLKTIQSVNNMKIVTLV